VATSDRVDGGETGRIHLAVLLASYRLPVFGGPRLVRPWLVSAALQGAAVDADAESQFRYVSNASWGWLRFGLVSGLTLAPLAWFGHVIAGDGGRNVGIALSGGAVFFCLTGGAYCTWKTVWALLARRQYRRHGTDTAFWKLRARALLRDSSLFFQSIVGIATLLIVLLSHP
jgi:hypothetical protein